MPVVGVGGPPRTTRSCHFLKPPANGARSTGNGGTWPEGGIGGSHTLHTPGCAAHPRPCPPRTPRTPRRESAPGVPRSRRAPVDSSWVQFRLSTRWGRKPCGTTRAPLSNWDFCDAARRRSRCDAASDPLARLTGAHMAARTSRHESELLIGGKWVAASDGTYDIINPATEEVVGQAPNGSAGDALAAAAAAKEAQPAWAAWSVEERSALMLEAARAIRAKSNELLPLVIAETGATATVGSRMQVPVAADRFERYARDPRQVLQTPLLPQSARATPLAPGGIIGGMITRLPVGVVSCITSYNFPMVNMAGKVAPALAAG